MKAIKEIHQFDPIFPFVYLHEEKGNPEERVQFYHFHDWYELVFVHEGNGKFFIDHDFFSMEQHDLYLIPGNVIHKVLAEKKTPYKCSVILFHPMLIYSHEIGDHFSYLDSFKALSNSGGFQLKLSQEQMEIFKKLLGEMQEEYQSNDIGSRSALLLLLHQILLKINRTFSTSEYTPEVVYTKREKWMRDVLHYIDLHYTEEHLSLSFLAQQALVSPEHFSRTFKKITGFTLPAYLEWKRLVHAKEMLLKTDHHISFISDACGYKSLPHFHKRFKQRFGLTPGEFRKNV